MHYKRKTFFFTDDVPLIALQAQTDNTNREKKTNKLNRKKECGHEKKSDKAGGPSGKAEPVIC